MRLPIFRHLFTVSRAETVRASDDRGGKNSTVFRIAHDVRRGDQAFRREDTGVQNVVQGGPRPVVSVGVFGTVRSPSRVQVRCTVLSCERSDI